MQENISIAKEVTMFHIFSKRQSPLSQQSNEEARLQTPSTPFSDPEEEFTANKWTTKSPNEETNALVLASQDLFAFSHPLHDNTISPHALKLVLTGIALGDMIGQPYEGGYPPTIAKNGVKNKEAYQTVELIKPFSHVTDDTNLAFAVVEATKDAKSKHLTDNQIVACYASYLRKLAKRFPDAGYGGNFLHWALHDANNPKYKSFANGGAMRAGGIGAMFKKQGDVIRYATLSALPTHSSPEGIAGAVVTAMSVWLGLYGLHPHKIVSYIVMHNKNVDQRH